MVESKSDAEHVTKEWLPRWNASKDKDKGVAKFEVFHGIGKCKAETGTYKWNGAEWVKQ